MRYSIGKYLIVLFILIILGILVTAVEFQFIQNALTGRPDIVRSTNQSGNEWTFTNLTADNLIVNNITSELNTSGLGFKTEGGIRFWLYDP